MTYHNSVMISDIKAPKNYENILIVSGRFYAQKKVQTPINLNSFTPPMRTHEKLIRNYDHTKKTFLEKK